MHEILMPLQISLFKGNCSVQGIRNLLTVDMTDDMRAVGESHASLSNFSFFRGNILRITFPTTQKQFNVLNA